MRAIPVIALLLCAAALHPAQARQFPDPERFEADIQRFEQQDKREPPSERAVAGGAAGERRVP
jgi:hypothetical protein